jgi:Phage antirepressor protein KilAC domain
MNNEPMPHGCLSIEAAAQLLGLSQNQVRKLLHDLHWLEKKDGHNTPTKLGIEAGFLKKQARGYPAPFNKNRTLTYYAPVITEHGIHTIMQQKFKHKPVQPTETVITQELPKEHFFNSSEDARKKALEQMSEWGILDKKVG